MRGFDGFSVRSMDSEVISSETPLRPPKPSRSPFSFQIVRTARSVARQERQNRASAQTVRGPNSTFFSATKEVGGAAPRGVARFLAIPAPEVLEPVVLNAIITPEFSTARSEQST